MKVPIIINLMFVVIIIGFIAYIIEKKIRIKKLVSSIEEEPEKYSLNSSYNIHSNSNNIVGNIILVTLIAIILGTLILFFMGNPYYGTTSFIIIILFLSLINFSPYYITINDDKIYYKHLIDTLNRTIIIPITKIEYITYLEETLMKKKLSLCINEHLNIDINVLLISNYDEIIKVLKIYMNTKEETILKKNIQNNINDLKKIKVRTNTDYKLLMILCMLFEIGTIYSFFVGNHDAVTITALIGIPLFMLRFFPYTIVFYGDRLEYKNLLHTHNKIERIYINDINTTDVVLDTLSYSKNVRHYTLNIYKKNNDIISLRLFYENIGDVKQISNIINSNNT